MTNSSDCVAVLVPEIKGNDILLPEKNDKLTLGDYVPVLQQYKGINAAMVFDYRSKTGNAAARSHVAKLRKVKAPLNDIHKRMKAEYLAITTKMDADKRDALAVVEEMIEHHDKELRIVAAEEAEAAKRAKEEKEVADCWDLAHEMNAMFDRQLELDRQQAEQDRIAKEQAEALQKIEQAKREKEIAEKAAEEATRRANEQAERDKQAAADREKKAAEEATKAMKDAEARAARAEAEAEAKAEAEAEEARKAEVKASSDLENIKRVHWAIVPVLVEKHGMSEDAAKSLILAIRNGEVPAVSINYQWKVA